MDNYLDILEDSLKQKVDVLNEIQSNTNMQEEILKKDKFSMEEFDKIMDKKEELIQKLEKLDEGFESVYERVRSQLSERTADYKEEIGRMQVLIREITDKSTAIQVKERRNKSLLDAQLSIQRRNLSNGMRNTTTIYNRYHNLNGAVESKFMDQKQ